MNTVTDCDQKDNQPNKTFQDSRIDLNRHETFFFPCDRNQLSIRKTNTFMLRDAFVLICDLLLCRTFAVFCLFFFFRDMTPNRKVK